MFEPVREFRVDQLSVKVYSDRQTMGQAAARFVRSRICDSSWDELRMIFAAAPSQNEFLRALKSFDNIDWPRMTAFHMDEYLGLPADAPQAFGRFLKDRLLDHVPLKQVHLINGNADDAHECQRYADLLTAAPVDIVCLGIGENGHLAFNDPPVADFDDPEWIKVVELDDVCRQQQVNDGCFASLEEVPRKAMTLTIPALMESGCISGVVPGQSKARAVREALQGPVSTQCPASILRHHPNAVLHLDMDSARELAH